MGIRIPALGDKNSQFVATVINGETTNAIPVGTPVAYVMNGTNDGYAVVLPATAGASKATTFFAGIYAGPQSSLAAGAIGDVVFGGIVTNALITLQTRATSTDSFNSAQSLAVGAVLQVDTVGNRLTAGATVGASNQAPLMALAQTVGVVASSSSASTNTSTAVTASVKIFIQIM